MVWDMLPVCEADALPVADTEGVAVSDREMLAVRDCVSVTAPDGDPLIDGDDEDVGI